MKSSTKGWPIAVLLALLSAGCATQPPAPDFQAMVASPDRSDADRATETETLHRIEEAVVRREIEAAGFRFVAEGGFLRNPQDPRDAPVFKPKQPNDEFVLKFVKP